MAIQRGDAFVWGKYVAMHLAGASQCAWAAWFRAHYKYEKRPAEFNAEGWSLDHAALVEAKTAELRGLGFDVYVENQNWFRLERDGIILAAKPDLVAVKSGHALVVECMTGARHDWHVAQVLVYMAMLPRARPLLSGFTVEGLVEYRSGPPVVVENTQLTDEFRLRLKTEVREVGGDVPPNRVASPLECGFCDIGGSDCADRLESHDEPPVTDHDLF